MEKMMGKAFMPVVVTHQRISHMSVHPRTPVALADQDPVTTISHLQSEIFNLEETNMRMKTELERLQSRMAIMEGPQAQATPVLAQNWTDVNFIFACLGYGIGAYFFLSIIYKYLVKWNRRASVNTNSSDGAELHSSVATGLAFRRSAQSLRVPSPTMAEPNLQARLREETEDPWAKARLFLWPALFAAAGIGTFFAVTALIAEKADLRPAASDSFLNLGVDLAAIIIIGVLWRREVTQRDARLRRIMGGAALASLRVQLLENGRAVKLSELRASSSDAAKSSKRVVVVAAEEEALGASLSAARESSRALVGADLLMVPLLLANQEKGSNPLSAISVPPPPLVTPVGGEAAHVAVPLNVKAWQEVISSELETALGQDVAAASRGLTLILKKNGRVGTRRLGLPDWEGLIRDVDARAWGGLDTTNI